MTGSYDVAHRSGTLVADMDTGRVGVQHVAPCGKITVRLRDEEWTPADPSRLRVATDDERRALGLGPRVRP